MRAFNRRLRSLTRETQRSMGDITQVLQETIEGQKVVKIFGGQEYERGRFDAAVNRVRRLHHEGAARLRPPTCRSCSCFAAIAVGVVIYQVTLDVQADRTTVGSFVSFIAAMLLVTGAAQALDRRRPSTSSAALSAAESVFALLDESARG